MKLKTAIEILEYHQEWRLGKREDMIHNPKKLTEALDVLVDFARSLNHQKLDEKKQKIYISGKISGIENEAPELFAKAEKELQAKGFVTVNPMTLNHDHDKSWESYMKEDVKALCDCDEIFMLSNWRYSRGAIIEHTIAMYLGLKISYENK